MDTSTRAGPLSRPLFLGFALASIGGPLALVVLYVPGAVGSALPSAGLALVAAAAIFVAPLYVWFVFSRRIASSGGLADFVAAGAGERIALVQAGIWSLSYFLYLPFTVTYIVYDLLPVPFPSATPYRAAIQVLLPVVLTLAVAGADRSVIGALGLAALLQLGVLVALGAVAIADLGAPASSFTAHGGHGLAGGAAAVSLLFLCASLPIFLGGEVEGGGASVRRGLVTAFSVVVATVCFAAFPLASVRADALGGEIPGFEFARTHGGHAFAVLVAAVAAVSVGGLVAAEFVALTRLARRLLGTPTREAALAIGALFVSLAAISLLNPNAFYERMLLPSLVALYVSQLLVFAAFPLYRLRRAELTLVDLVAALGAAALMGYGLWVLATEGVAT